MDRKSFIKKSLLAGVAGSTLPSIATANSSTRKSTYDKLMNQVGFNHLPNKKGVSSNSAQIQLKH